MSTSSMRIEVRGSGRLAEDPVANGPLPAGAPECLVHYTGPRLDDALSELTCSLERARTYSARFVLTHRADAMQAPDNGVLDEESQLLLGAYPGPAADVTLIQLLAEQLCFAYRDAHHLSAVVARLFGSCEAVDHLAMAAIQGAPMPTGNPNLACCLTHPQDLNRGLLLTAGHGSVDGKILQIGDASVHTRGDIARRLWALSGHADEPTFAPADAPFAPPIDVTKAERLLDFRSSYSLDRILLDALERSRRRSFRV